MKTVNIVLRSLNSPYPEDIDTEVVRVFKGTRIRAANRWAEEQEKEGKREYLYRAETWKVD